jgi:hypothetical protein
MFRIITSRSLVTVQKMSCIYVLTGMYVYVHLHMYVFEELDFVSRRGHVGLSVETSLCRTEVSAEGYPSCHG